LLERPPPDAHAEAGLRRELGLRRQVAHELHRLEEPLAANVADHSVLFRDPLETAAQPRPLLPRIPTQITLQYLLDDGNACRAGHRPSFPGMPLDEAGVLLDRSPENIRDFFAADHG